MHLAAERNELHAIGVAMQAQHFERMAEQVEQTKRHFEAERRKRPGRWP
jgi:hypothetical protein